MLYFHHYDHHVRFCLRFERLHDFKITNYRLSYHRAVYKYPQFSVNVTLMIHSYICLILSPIHSIIKFKNRYVKPTLKLRKHNLSHSHAWSVVLRLKVFLFHQNICQRIRFFMIYDTYDEQLTETNVSRQHFKSAIHQGSYYSLFPYFP